MKMGEIPNVEFASLRKSWDRYCAEETKNHEKIKDYEDYAIIKSNNNIAILAEEFFSDLSKEYDIPYKVLLESLGLSASLTDLYKNFNPFAMMNRLNQQKGQSDHEFEGGKVPLVAENETRLFMLFVLKEQVSIAIFEHAQHNFEQVKNFLTFYLSSDFSYKSLCDRLRKERNCKSFAALYETLDDSISTVNPFKRIIEKAMKSDKNPSWSDFDLLLTKCSPELQKQFIAKYLLSGVENALQEVFQITSEHITGIKEVLLRFSEEKEFSHDVFEIFFANMLQVGYTSEEEKKTFCGKTNGVPSFIIQRLYSLVIHRYQLKAEHQLPFEKLHELIVHLSDKEIAPHASQFFIPYFKAYIAVTCREFDKAMELFNTAFEYKQFAGDYLVEFLEMAFCFANYYKANWIAARKSIRKEDGVQNPVSCDAKMFKNFGYAIGAFPESAEDSYSETFNNLDYFYSFFPPECFADVELAKKIQKQEYKNQHKITIETDGRRKQKFVKNHPYEVLFKLKGKDRNKLLPEKSLFTLNKDHNPKQKDLCPPFVLCIRYSLQDERLLGLAENWLSDSENEIDTTAVSFDGKTALCEALRIYAQLKSHIYSATHERIRNLQLDAYKRMKENGYDSSSKKYSAEIKNCTKQFSRILDTYRAKYNRYKRLVKILIERTGWEHELKFGVKIPVLAWAIEAYDFELVRQITEKIPISEFDNYKISYKETSPLIYAVERKEAASFGLREYIRKQKDIHIPHVINENSFGLTREEKQRNFMYENPQPEAMDFTMYHMEHWDERISEKEVEDFISRFGDEETFSEQVEEYDKIIDYFLERTQGVDAIIRTTRTMSSPFRRSETDKRIPAMAELQTHFTALFLVGMANDADTCQKLLKRGAKPDFPVEVVGFFREQFGEVEYFEKNNFIYNLIDHKSWETLIMFLTEFKDEVSHLMHNNEFEMNPLMSFAAKVQDYFIWTGRDKRAWRPVVQYMADLFIDCGANPDEKTKIGTARGYLEKHKIFVR
ncbi:MAG: hypothetical protein IJ158_00715 [Treponema sp.]|nr:hypothetical protein [Treponema sp.]